jgi:hypothetical protein
MHPVKSDIAESITKALNNPENEDADLYTPQTIGMEAAKVLSNRNWVAREFLQGWFCQHMYQNKYAEKLEQFIDRVLAAGRTPKTPAIYNDMDETLWAEKWSYQKFPQECPDFHTDVRLLYHDSHGNGYLFLMETDHIGRSLFVRSLKYNTHPPKTRKALMAKFFNEETLWKREGYICDYQHDFAQDFEFDDKSDKSLFKERIYTGTIINLDFERFFDQMEGFESITDEDLKNGEW